MESPPYKRIPIKENLRSRFKKVWFKIWNWSKKNLVPKLVDKINKHIAKAVGIADEPNKK